MRAVDLLDRCDFPAETVSPTGLALGVSGGADSVAMALLADAAGLDFVVWHVHHGLRPEADDEVVVVEKLAASLGRPCEVRRVEVAPGADLESRARTARYDALPTDVCVAHTADDRAETVLLNLFRGAGLAGVAAPFARVHRPILRLRRHETRTLCEHAGVEVVDDPMNADPSFARVAVRTRLLPAVAEVLGRDPVPVLTRHADLMGDALAVVQAAAAALDPVDTVALRSVPRAVAAEALRQWLMAETGSAHAVDAGSIERVMAVVEGVCVATEVTGGHRVARTGGRLRIEG